MPSTLPAPLLRAALQALSAEVTFPAVTSPSKQTNCFRKEGVTFGFPT